MTPSEIVAVSHGYQRRMDTAAWVFGRYTQEALSAVLSVALGRKGKTPYRYPSQPYSAAEAPQEAAPAAEEAPAAEAAEAPKAEDGDEDDPFDAIFNIFNKRP